MDDENDELWPCIVCCEAFSRSREKLTVLRLQEHTRIVPLVVSTTPATIAILNNLRWVRRSTKQCTYDEPKKIPLKTLSLWVIYLMNFLKEKENVITKTKSLSPGVAVSNIKCKTIEQNDPQQTPPWNPISYTSCVITDEQIHTHTHIHTHTRTHARTHARTYVRMYVYIYKLPRTDYIGDCVLFCNSWPMWV